MNPFFLDRLLGKLWSSGVAVVAPSFDDHLRLHKAVEDRAIQVLVPEFTFEGLADIIRAMHLRLMRHFLLFRKLWPKRETDITFEQSAFILARIGTALIKSRLIKYDLLDEVIWG